MPSEVFLLIFANSQSNPLDSLLEEEQEIYRTLQQHEDGGYLNVVRESHPSAEIINERLKRFSDRIALFHYSGHAGDTMLLFNDTKAHANGIAYQLAQSAKKGVLKLVILNGCSTHQQVKQLLDCGVPAVIATQAAVGDSSARAFAVSFFHNISEIEMNIRDAFFKALGPAQLARGDSLNIGEKKVRHLNFFEEDPEPTDLWELFCINDEAVEINPIPPLIGTGGGEFKVNKLLTNSLFEVLYNEGSELIKKLKEIGQGEHLNLSTKQNAIVNALPFPVGTHLQKLFTSPESDEGYDTISLRRIEQIAEVFNTTVELMGFAMLSQLWELKLKNDVNIPELLLKSIKNYFQLTPDERSGFNYLLFIKSIRKFFDSLNIPYFIDELAILQTINNDDHPFGIACRFLTNLRQRVILHTIRETEVPDLCRIAEENLCVFFENTGFLHRYNLTSIKQIDIQKYRHSPKAEFNHSVIKLMQATGEPDRIYYKWNDYLDNPGVILLKVDLKQSGRDGHYIADNLQFLNLSPFVIDKNSYESNTDRSNLMFFQQFRKPAGTNSGVYRFKNVRKPDTLRDYLEIKARRESEENKYKNEVTMDRFEAIRLEFEAFHATFLNENL